MSLQGQGSRSQTLGIGDPRHRRAGQSLSDPASIVDAPVIVNDAGRITVDPDWWPVYVQKRRYVGTGISATAAALDQIVGVTSTAAARTITLPTARNRAGAVLSVKDESGGAAVNNITIAAAPGETVDGGASVTISTNYGSKTVYSNGTNWFTV